MIVIIRIDYSILSMTLLHYWVNVWFPPFNACLFWDIAEVVNLGRHWIQVWLHFLFINVFEIWATYVITGWRFTPSVVRYQIGRRLTFRVVCLRVWYSVRKPNFNCASPACRFFYAISSWINGGFKGLIPSILKEFWTCPIFDEMILHDPSQITISGTKMHFI